MIPALNEAPAIEGAVASAEGAFEVIVADGGSTDGTIELARALGARVISAPPGRGAQMDAGAGAASGDVFLFLHADTRLPEGWKGAVGRGLAGGAVAGAFRLSIRARGLRYRLVEWLARLRCRVLGLVYGDQAVFAPRGEFFAAGGYRALPLMEDVDCVKRLRARGGFALLPERVATSPRRWDQSGVLGNTLRNWSILGLYFLGVSPERLYRLYYGGSRKRRGRTETNKMKERGNSVKFRAKEGGGYGS